MKISKEVDPSLVSVTEEEIDRASHEDVELLL